jgi:hypothetical protein
MHQNDQLIILGWRLGYHATPILDLVREAVGLIYSNDAPCVCPPERTLADSQVGPLSNTEV